VNPARATVPGNILLLGEYAVLEEGGLGVALAVEPRVQLEAAPEDGLVIESRWPGGTADNSFVDAAVHTVSAFLGTRCNGRLLVDSMRFFSADGRKSGFGSSAAVTVALVSGLLRLAGRSVGLSETAALAVQAHRLAQGGRGSGYDVLTSLHGGSGKVRGGAAPTWEAVPLPVGCEPSVFPGTAAVSYQDWKARSPGPARDFLRESNAAIRSFCGAPTLERAWPFFDASRKLGIELGKATGVSAEITPPPGLDPSWCKAAGAGNELGICLAQVLPGSQSRLLRAAARGLTWEP